MKKIFAFLLATFLVSAHAQGQIERLKTTEDVTITQIEHVDLPCQKNSRDFLGTAAGVATGAGVGAAAGRALGGKNSGGSWLGAAIGVAAGAYATKPDNSHCQQAERVTIKFASGEIAVIEQRPVLNRYLKKDTTLPAKLKSYDSGRAEVTLQ